jgi:cobalt-zinc-cadmium efflux system outer membrane protein
VYFFLGACSGLPDTSQAMPISRASSLFSFRLLGAAASLVLAAKLVAADPLPTASAMADMPGATAQVSITPELLDQLVAEGRANSPGLQAAGARTESATAAVAAVRTWEDPTASFGLWAPTSRGFKSSEQGNLIYGVDQKLPLYGRPDLMRKVAAADASREQFAADFEAQKLRRDLQVALNGLALASREAEIAEQDLAWLDATLDAVDHRYRVGQASQVDWLKIQTARAMATDDLKTKAQERDHSALSLNRLLNRDLHAAWPRVAVPSLQPPIYYTPQLVDAALAAEPQLKVMRQESVSAQAAADLTRRQRLPDVSVGVQARQYSGDGGFREGMATVSFSVPWLNRSKYDNDWRRDQQRKRASDFAATDQALSVREELHHHVVDLDAARRQAVLYRDQLIPLTQQTLASAQTVWEHNLGPFQDILEAHRMLLADQLALAHALTDQGTMLAEIAFLTGHRDVGALVALAGDPPPDHDDPVPDHSK